MSTLAFGSLTLRVFASHDDIAATVSTLFAPARVENWMHHATEFEKQRLSNLMESMMAWLPDGPIFALGTLPACS